MSNAKNILHSPSAERRNVNMLHKYEKGMRGNIHLMASKIRHCSNMTCVVMNDPLAGEKVKLGSPHVPKIRVG